MATRFLYRALWTAALGIALSPLLAATITTNPARTVAVLDVGAATAEAAPSVSPFAGTYSWGGLVTISDRGHIAASYDDGQLRITTRGRVSDDGRYSYTQTVTTFDLRRHRLSQFSTQHAGTMELDDVGNIVGTPSTGGSFTWYRY